ncbi:MAG: Lrp/AsnC family transcriptional regulator [Streptomycetaceae bacterium]|nr:Lrp/AsnC family transcriptional regulator [Streptomycetaceae bacterium]
MSELDLAIVNALQISPRAPWAVVAKALRVDAVTVARRWERMREAGLAWVTAYPLDQAGAAAFIEIDCAPGHNAEVADALSRDPQAVTVEHTAGGRDLLATVLAPDFEVLSAYVVDRLGGMPGVMSTRTHLSTRGYAEGGRWRLGSLDREQRETISALARPRGAGPTDLAAHRDLVLALGPDGRLSLTDLAAALGVSVNTAGRRLSRLLESGQLGLRCELARSLSGAPVAATLWADVPPEHLDAAGNHIANLPEVRMCMATAGPHNLLTTVWLRSLGDAHHLEIRLAQDLPHLRIAERAVALRAVKLMGRLLDPAGRAAGFVPLDVWARPQAVTPEVTEPMTQAVTGAE